VSSKNPSPFEHFQPLQSYTYIKFTLPCQHPYINASFLPGDGFCIKWIFCILQAVVVIIHGFRCVGSGKDSSIGGCCGRRTRYRNVRVSEERNRALREQTELSAVYGGGRRDDRLWRRLTLELLVCRR
jgi:hypothetical protein